MGLAPIFQTATTTLTAFGLKAAGALLSRPAAYRAAIAVARAAGSSAH